MTNLSIVGTQKNHMQTKLTLVDGIGRSHIKHATQVLEIVSEFRPPKLMTSFSIY